MVIFEYYLRLSFPLCMQDLVVNRTGYLNMYSDCLEFDIQYGFLTCPIVGYRASTNIIQTRYQHTHLGSYELVLIALLEKVHLER